MKKPLLFVASLLFLQSQTLAHDFWTIEKEATVGVPLTVLLGFGDNFPDGEEITAEQMKTRFEPLRAWGPDGELSLTPGAEPRLAVSEKPITTGSYLLAASSQIGFNSQTPDGWVRLPKDETKGATRCGYGGNFAKAIVNVGDSTDSGTIQKTLGHKLEIVPLINPVIVKVGQPFPVKVLKDGQPLPRASLGAYFAGFTADGSALAFSAMTSKEGLVNIIPLRSGYWLAKVNFRGPYADTAKCDTENFNATLTFRIND